MYTYIGVIWPPNLQLCICMLAQRFLISMQQSYSEKKYQHYHDFASWYIQQSSSRTEIKKKKAIQPNNVQFGDMTHP